MTVKINQKKQDQTLLSDLRRGLKGEIPECTMAAAAFRIEELLRRLDFYENGGLRHALTPVTGFHRDGVDYLWFGAGELMADAAIEAGAKLMIFVEPGKDKVMLRPQEEFFADDGLEHRTVAEVLKEPDL